MIDESVITICRCVTFISNLFFWKLKMYIYSPEKTAYYGFFLFKN